MTVMSALASVVEQDGIIDNIFVSPSVHEASGGVVLIAMLVATGWTARLALQGEAIGRGAQASLIVAQISLIGAGPDRHQTAGSGVGSGPAVHPLRRRVSSRSGSTLGAGWVAWTNPATKTRVTAILSTLGLMSAAMAFVIGRAYVEGTL